MNKPRDQKLPHGALQKHYLVDRELADRLRTAPPGERQGLYRTVYNELFLRVPEHGQNSRKEDAAALEARARRQMGLLQYFSCGLKPCTFR
jgi:hypothetical protein